MVTGPGPYYAPLADLDRERAHRNFDNHVWLAVAIAQRRAQLRATLPIGRVVGPADVAALAVHIMTNAALTGATYDIDGGQQLVASR